MAKKVIKGIVKTEEGDDSKVFTIERRGSYTIPGRLIDEEDDPDFNERKKALNSAYRPFGIRINDIDGVYASHSIAIPGFPEVEEIYHEISDWERIKPKKTAKSATRGRVRWAPAQLIYGILDAFD